jgi:Uma2 family endonuclease
MASVPQNRGFRIRHPDYDDGSRPTWEVAYLFPAQGHWSERDYLALEGICGDKIRAELSRGRLEMLPVPTLTHQFILKFLLYALDGFVMKHALGTVLPSGTRVRVKPGKRRGFREPDVVYMNAERAKRQRDDYWDGADLVMEVVSGDAKDRRRDLVTKVKEYALAGIPEYWVIDPDQKFIRVYALAGTAYRLHGEFRPGETATSVLLPGFAVGVDVVLAAGEGAA